MAVLDDDELDVLEVPGVACVPVVVVVFVALLVAMPIMLQSATTTINTTASVIHNPLWLFFGGGTYGPCGGWNW